VRMIGGAYTGAGWATSISPGPGSESWQTVTFIVTNNNNSLFSTQPAVSSSGTLTFTSATNACGSVTVSVQAHDDGGTANGGQDTSAAQTFTITVTCVNDPPSFTKGPDVSVGENSGAQSLASWATAISPGPPNETGQGLSFTVTNNNNALFSVQPAINPAGTLSFTPALNAIGSATVSAKLVDSGGTANGGQNTSPQQVFTITINFVNRPPVAVPDSLYAYWNRPLSFSAGILLTNDYDPDGGTLSVAGVISPSAQNGSVSLTNTLVTYQPPANYAGSDSFGYLLADGQGGQSTGTVSVTVVKPLITAWSPLSNGLLRLQFQGIPATAYKLQSTTNLRDWDTQATNTTDSTGVLQVDDAQVPAPPAKYYRFQWP